LATPVCEALLRGGVPRRRSRREAKRSFADTGCQAELGNQKSLRRKPKKELPHPGELLSEIFSLSCRFGPVPFDERVVARLSRPTCQQSFQMKEEREWCDDSWCAGWR
jgi:hypothetical protein